MSRCWYVGVFEPLSDGTAHLVDSRRFIGADGRRNAYRDFCHRVAVLSGGLSEIVFALPDGDVPYMGIGALVKTAEGPRVVAYHGEVPQA